MYGLIKLKMKVNLDLASGRIDAALAAVAFLKIIMLKQDQNLN